MKFSVYKPLVQCNYTIAKLGGVEIVIESAHWADSI